MSENKMHTLTKRYFKHNIVNQIYFNKIFLKTSLLKNVNHHLTTQGCHNLQSVKNTVSVQHGKTRHALQRNMNGI